MIERNENLLDLTEYSHVDDATLVLCTENWKRFNVNFEKEWMRHGALLWQMELCAFLAHSTVTFAMFLI